jgi:hypothetical protein
VAALQTIYQFQLTPIQMQKLRELAAETAQKAKEREPGAATAAFRKALTELRAALIEASDEEKIEQAEEKLEELRDSEKPKLHDDVDITAAARKQTAAVLAGWTRAQRAHFADENTEEIQDPLEQLTATLDKVRGLDGESFKELRDEVAGEVAVLAAGIKADRFDDIKKKTVELLNQVHKLNADDFTAQRPELDKKAAEITGKLTSTEYTRNFVEHAVAELLSNPRLASALEARLQK